MKLPHIYLTTDFGLWYVKTGTIEIKMMDIFEILKCWRARISGETD